ncbi:hypothetical protein LTR16_011453 [Cryomyces antarcticus]|uniref:DNA-directed RNA polymerase n=1 Tax=Cryomyces antarcticus TaxID=329879 RepID=A0ABR0ITP5_9PEZI|nr:hypothetical protein LTR39_003623 [Cryomyces antarcticus]KAK5014042.1 hypothetical protein LTR60_003558 [Cryomyces antarcticus]KAK5044988.1 hypothetical protein LTR16_011453 [Cryomyces antarcticus]
MKGAPRGKGGVIKKHAKSAMAITDTTGRCPITDYADIEAGQVQLGNILFTKAERIQHKVEARACGDSVQKGKVTQTPFDEATTSLSADGFYESVRLKRHDGPLA